MIRQLVLILALFFLVIFAFIGSLILSVIFHEYSHYRDYQEFNTTDEELCALSLPTSWPPNISELIYKPVGYYRFEITLNKSDSEIVKKYYKISSVTESKATVTGASVLVFFLICYWIIIKTIGNDKTKILDQGVYINQLENFILSHYSGQIKNP
jgi:hypothetical protein